MPLTDTGSLVGGSTRSSHFLVKYMCSYTGDASSVADLVAALLSSVLANLLRTASPLRTLQQVLLGVSFQLKSRCHAASASSTLD